MPFWWDRYVSSFRWGVLKAKMCICSSVLQEQAKQFNISVAYTRHCYFRTCFWNPETKNITESLSRTHPIQSVCSRDHFDMHRPFREHSDNSCISIVKSGLGCAELNYYAVSCFLYTKHIKNFWHCVFLSYKKCFASPKFCQASGSAFSRETVHVGSSLPTQSFCSPRPCGCQGISIWLQQRSFGRGKMLVCLLYLH